MIDDQQNKNNLKQIQEYQKQIETYKREYALLKERFAKTQNEIKKPTQATAAPSTPTPVTSALTSEQKKALDHLITFYNAFSAFQNDVNVKSILWSLPKDIAMLKNIK